MEAKNVAATASQVPAAMWLTLTHGEMQMHDLVAMGGQIVEVGEFTVILIAFWKRGDDVVFWSFWSFWFLWGIEFLGVGFGVEGGIEIIFRVRKNYED